MSNKSLIICTTPLQMLIAERIVELNPTQEFYAIILWVCDSGSKARYYGDRLISKCGGGTYLTDKFYSPLKIWEQIVELLRLRAHFYLKYRHFDRIYVSSYDIIPLRVLIGTLKNAEIYSFDDGFLNLHPETYNSFRRDMGGILYKLLVYPIRLIKERKKGHYTIYDGENAAYHNPQKINLFQVDYNDNTVETSETIQLVLGQPIFEPDKARCKEVTQNLVDKIGYALYLPHPREIYQIDGVEYVDTPYIAEDYLLQELEKYPYRRYVLHSFFSTTLINLLGHPRIEVRAYRPKDLPEKWVPFYEILEERQIPVIDF